MHLIQMSFLAKTSKLFVKEFLDVGVKKFEESISKLAV